MAYTQADLDALEQEIKDVRLIEQQQHADRSVRYRPLKDLLELRATMAASIAASAGNSRSGVAAVCKGV